jgi:hypothetical protein
MNERTRRVVFATLLVLSVLGAVLLMSGSLLGDPVWRMRLQVVALCVALGGGTICGVLAWRWWGDQLLDERPLTDSTGPLPVRDDTADDTADDTTGDTRPPGRRTAFSHRAPEV